MTYLSEEERAAVRAVGAKGANARARRAEALVNPASGLANDYLNLFNEIVMLVEQLPTMPGRLSAIEQYDRLDERFRRDFEAVVEELDRRATGSVAAVRRQFKMNNENDPALAVLCERAGASIRETLDKATMLVNHGALVSGDMVQMRTDQLFAKLSR
jgi:hypothetical protein